MLMKLYERVGEAEVIISKICLVVLTTLVFISAVVRKMGHPQSWTVDMATFLFAWCVFLGADAAMRRDGLVNIDLFVNLMPKKVQEFLKLLNNIIIIVFLVVMIVFGIYLCYTTRFRSFSGLPWLSYTWVTLSVPVGCMLMLVTISLKTKAMFKKKGGEEE